MPDHIAGTQMDDCTACPIAEIGRRRFIYNVLTGVAGVLLTPSLSRASTLLLENVTPVASKGDQRTYPIPAADSVQIDHDADVILVRWENVVYAFNLSCPHQRTALRWIDADRHFQCPKHKSQYTPSGEFIKGRATRGMDRLDITKEGNNVVVNLDSMHRQDQDLAGWSSAMVHLT